MKKNYSAEPLFPDWLIPSPSSIDMLDMSFSDAVQESSSEFVSIKTGLIIETVAWIPDQAGDSDPVLALLCKPKDLPYMKMNHTAPTEQIVQFWKVVGDKNDFVATYLFSIVQPDGPVCAMKFCPSGGYSKERMALLALTSVTGDVNIVAVPQFRKEFEGKGLKLKPSCVLRANVQSVGTIVDWDQRKGHNVVMAGYLNGMIAMWRLSDRKATSKLLIDSEGHLLPFRIIQPYAVPITALEMNNSYFLAVGGPQLKVYDMTSGGDCREIYSYLFTVMDITCAQWIPNTPFMVTGINRSSTSIGMYVAIPFNLTWEQFRLISSNNVISTASFSPSMARYVVGTSDGELWTRSLGKPSAWSAGDNFRRKISQIDGGQVHMLKKGVNPKPKDPEMVTGLAWNRTKSCQKWYAVAYEKGLVRVNKLAPADNF